MAKRKVRYAVVGLGHFAQKAILPAFAHARPSSELTALVSADPKKLRTLARSYGVARCADYDGLDALCRDDAIDAVYLATPNDTHRALVERVAPHGIHVLCEKPMAVTEDDCEAMIRACHDYDCKLMIGYRLHFEAANQAAAALVGQGAIGEPRAFRSIFTYQAHAPNVRLEARVRGGGALYDIGVYCINAARSLFGDEPTEVVGLAARGDDARFAEVEEQVAAILRFSGGRLATFTVGFGAAGASAYEIVGAAGRLRVERAYAYEGVRALKLTTGTKKPRRRRFKACDQIAAELSYFSECILEGRAPEPSGSEGLADVRVIRAIYRSIDEGRPVRLGEAAPAERPAPARQSSAPMQ